MPLNYVYPTFILIAALTVLGWAIGRRSKFYGKIITPRANARYESLDGLRGMLAVGVLVHHGLATQVSLTTNHWTLADYPAFEMLGTLSVGMFFMITGFLFWGKVLADDGRLHLRNHFRGRITRLAPMYLSVAVIAMTITVCSLWQQHIPISTAIKTAFSMMAMGIAPWFKPHGFDTSRIVAGVTWTLRYEWIFYGVLPLLVFLRRPKWVAMMFISYLVYFAATTPHWTAKPLGPSVNLLGGMICAQLQHAGLFRRVAWQSRWISLLTVATLVAMPLFITHRAPLLTFPLTLGMFLVFVKGNTLFGVLTTAGSKVLGTMSYSIYLLHGVVLYLAHPLLRLVSGTAPLYWLTLTGLGLIVVAISAITYRWIEHPFIEMEHRRRKVIARAERMAPSSELSQPGITGAPWAHDLQNHAVPIPVVAM